MKTKKGFTLIELLIVIVILAVLASLVLPRMLAQPERSLIVEAVNYLGVIRRTQEMLVGTHEASWIGGAAVAGSAGNDGWKNMGMGTVPAASAFDYSCTAGSYGSGTATSAADTEGTCTAKRTNVPPGNPRSGGTITMRLYTGTITACGDKYVLFGAAGDKGTTCG